MNHEIQPLTVEILERMGETDSLLNARRLSGPAYAYLVDGEPIGAAGLGKIQQGSYFAWALITEKAKESKLLMRRITREVKRRFPVLRRELGLPRISAEAFDRPRYCRWLENLGFERRPIVYYEFEEGG